MSTPPVTPAPTVILANELTWLQKHERLIIVVLVLALGGWLGNKWMNQSAENAKSVLAVQQAASAAAASQADLAAKTYQAAIDAMSRQNVALAASQQARNTTLVKQQAATATVAPDVLITMWKGLIPGTMGGDIKLQDITRPDGVHAQQVIVDDGPAVETVNQLEEVPVLKANLSDETALAQNTQTALNSCSTLVDSQKTEIAEDKKTCDAKTASLKADARKSKRNWFITGLVTAATIVGFIAIHY